MLVKLCTDVYCEEDIECAKDVLHESICHTRESSRRRIKRRGDTKKLHDVQDILNTFLELPTQDVPIFVCRDLHNLPPLSMNNFVVLDKKCGTTSARDEDTPGIATDHYQGSVGYQ